MAELELLASARGGAEVSRWWGAHAVAELELVASARGCAEVRRWWGRMPCLACGVGRVEAARR